ncbi:protein transporter [Galdieria sulphuraria]|uniref:Protein transporter n=1 Tax=Galdieria sulphuraria TaxID=130081 RepID=M2VY15_GALSU|nr:protein transporter [Galdieria sulphuraria]EME28196.1 protein transporter [Galdieria sulphuraria]|eukprot:XP_005704716.1 protein transporter [Galdieria sulphuraria]
MDVTQLLLHAQSADFKLRYEAEQSLKQLEETNFPTFAASLATELADQSKPPSVRQLAGLVLKNKFDARSSVRREELAKRWAAVEDTESRHKVKALLLQTLSSEVQEARHTAAQVVAALAVIELPLGLWNELIEILLGYVVNQNSSDELRESSIMTLGYMCETASQNGEVDILSQRSSQILTAVVRGIEEPEEKFNIRFAAISALLNAIDFAKANFESETERTYIMNTVCKVASGSDERIRIVAFECFVKIAEYYYSHLDAYMNMLFQLTVNAITNDVESVALQAIEFWTTISEEEIYRNQEAEELNKKSSSMNYIVQALPYLCPVLLRCLLLQEEDQDEDSWNRATASGTCLTLVAQASKDAVVPFVIQFVQEHIGNDTDWRSREAATLAFGCILEPDGPSAQGLEPLVTEAVPILLNLLTRDSNVVVRDTSAWTLGRVCSLSKEATKRYLQPLTEAAFNALERDEPRVASNAAWIFLNIAESFEEDHDKLNNELDIYVEKIMSSLFYAAAREDAAEHHLQVSSYEAFAPLVHCVSVSCQNFIFQSIPLLLSRLEATFQMEVNGTEARNEQAETQGLICASLQAIIQRLRHDVVEYSDRMMQAFLFVLSSGSSSSEHEDALLAIGSLADAIGEDFNKYMSHFAPFLSVSLRNWDQVDLCKVAVGVVSDICRSLELGILPYADDIVMYLLSALSSPELDRTVKPPIITCFGDIALAISGKFERYFSHVMPILQQAAQASLAVHVSEDDFDTQDWVIELRESILQTCTSIIQGLKTDNRQELIISGRHSEWILQFCERVIQEKLCCTEKLIAAVVGVVGDIASALESLRPTLKQMPWIQQMIDQCSKSPDKDIQNVAMWAKGIVY